MATRALACAALCLAGSLAACAPTRVVDDRAPLVWPAAPDAPRIAFVTMFSRPADLGIHKGFLARLGDLVFGATEARLVYPMAVVEARGLLYVADPGARGVHRFDAARGGYELIRGAAGAVLPSPVGLARGGADEIYVTDSELAGVFVIRPGSNAAVAVALKAPLLHPTGVAFDAATGRLFVVDTGAHRVMIFDRDGNLAASFGGRGTADGEFNYPTLMWRSREGLLYVTDALNFRIQIFDAEGRFRTRFGRAGDTAGDLPRQKGVATDHLGHIYIADAVLHMIQVFDASGAFLLSVGGLGSDRGEFRLPTGMFIGDDDTIYVADSYNQRVQVLRYVGGAT